MNIFIILISVLGGAKLENDFHARVIPRRYTFIAIAETQLQSTTSDRAYKRM